MKHYVLGAEGMEGLTHRIDATTGSPFGRDRYIILTCVLYLTEIGFIYRYSLPQSPCD